jgi:hypothetical protein
MAKFKIAYVETILWEIIIEAENAKTASKKVVDDFSELADKELDTRYLKEESMELWFAEEIKDE